MSESANPSVTNAAVADSDLALAQGQRRDDTARQAGCTEPGLPLAHGQSLRIASADGDAQRLQIVSPNGHCSLEIQITETGPVLRLVGAEVTLSVEGKLQIEADDLKLRGRDAVTISSDGEIRSQGRSQLLESQRGDVRLQANDDVRLQGERVRVNC